MFTEDEARKKWCPMWKVQELQDSQLMSVDSNCIASDCMMWKESHRDDIDLRSPKIIHKVPPKLHELRTMIYGYCGLTK